MLAIALGLPPEGSDLNNGRAAWLVCTVCGAGAFATGYENHAHTVTPSPKPLEVPKYLPNQIEEAWRESLNCFTVEAYSSVALMCRKIIFYMAVEEGLPAEDSRGRGPNFTECVDHLVDEGVITRRQKEDWGDSIRKIGNTATHTLDFIDLDSAKKSLDFTLMLLKLRYTYPAQAAGGQESAESAESSDSISAFPTNSGIDPSS